MLNRAIERTKASVDEPWLLSREDLLGLDSKLDQAWQQLEEQRMVEAGQERTESLRQLREQNPNDSEEELERQFSRSRSRAATTCNRSCVLTLDNEARVEAPTLSDALQNREVLNQLIRGLDVRLESATRRVAVSARWKTIDLETSPDRDELAQAVFESLLHWREDVQPARRIVLWKRWSFAGILGAFWMLWMLAGSYAYLEGDRNAAYWRQESRKLLDGGIAKEEETRAVEVLLAKQAGYPAPPDSLVEVSVHPAVRRLRLFLGMATIPMIMLGIPPKSTIGVGRGKRRLARYRWWIGLVSVGIPLTLFGSLVVEPILDWLRTVM